MLVFYIHILPFPVVNSVCMWVDAGESFKGTASLHLSSVIWSREAERTPVFAWYQCHFEKVDKTIWWTGNVIFCRFSCIDSENDRAIKEENPRVLPCVRRHEIALYSLTWRRFHRSSHVYWTEDIDVWDRDCLGFICHYSRHIGSGRRNRVSKFGNNLQ